MEKYIFQILISDSLSLMIIKYCLDMLDLIAECHCVFHHKQYFVLSICLNFNMHFYHVSYVTYTEEP